MQASKGAKRAVDYPFSDDALREAGARPGVPPFAVVGANTMDESVGRYAFQYKKFLEKEGYT